MVIKVGIMFTPAQQRVIANRNSNLLVSAAAGSGKTAVLVERIIQRVMDAEKPIDIDRLLIVTFTSAAASEMRERIGEALLKKVEEFPENEHLQKQMTLIHNAQITTIDSFCLFVIRNNFNDIGLDPAFRVADEGELRLLRKDILAEVLEKRFAEKEEAFYHCVESYSINGKEKFLEENIEKLYQFAMSYPFPEKWLVQCKEDYNVKSLEELEQTRLVREAMEQIRQTVADCVLILQEAINICEQPDGPYMYVERLESEKKWAETTAEITDYVTCFNRFQTLAFERLSGKKDDSVSAEKREIAKTIRGTVKDCLLQIKETYFKFSPIQTLADISSSAPDVWMLLDLTSEFMEAFSVQKREKNLVDFSDMEHFALQILLKEEDIITPTKAAQDLQEYFEEIMIDEYQDSNLVQEYLLKSISKESQGIYNRFMVGDVKQSIYKFRLARPELFMDKYHAYDTADEKSKEQRIDLKQNFRSRREVIESVNYLFHQIMIKSLGGVAYDAESALYLGANYEEALQNQETELLLIEKEKAEEGEAESDKKELEAITIAKRIKELVGCFQVTDKERGVLRSASYRDIVILLRSNAGWDEVFQRILAEEGIPAHTTSKTGYFSATEIQVLLNFLRILDNPQQDIPLCAVMLTPVIGFSNEELALLRKKDKGNLYNSICDYLENGEIVALKVKLQVFLNKISHYREMTVYTPIHELLEYIMKKEGFYYYMSAMPAGEQRKANMDMLLEKAIAFEKTSYHGLFHFIRYIEQMEKYDVDFGEAGMQDEKADVVRIMSIHKSKGLEFPICIVAGMAKKFNMQDVRKTLVIDMDYGIGTDYMNPEERYKTTTLRKNMIAGKMKMENLGEELRILYVALTRAKEKLIMTGVLENPEKKLSLLLPLLLNTREPLSFTKLMGMNSYLEYIMAALVRHRCFAPILENYGFTANAANPLFHKGPEIKAILCQREQLVEGKIKERLQKDVLKRMLKQRKVGEELEQAVSKQFAFSYPHEILSKLYTKTTVSELKRMGYKNTEEAGKVLYEEKEIVPYIPKFMKEEAEISGSVRGSAYHRVLELLDLTQASSEKKIELQMAHWVKEGRLSQTYKEAVRVDKILQFAKTNLAKRMEEADKRQHLYREQPFVLGVSANSIQPEFPQEETILVQGIIDVYFEENEELVLVDYKTDRVESGEELWTRYQTQLAYYADALMRLTGKRVKEKVIYSFALEKEFQFS